jgi:hypothetical protein
MGFIFTLFIYGIAHSSGDSLSFFECIIIFLLSQIAYDIYIYTTKDKLGGEQK